MIQSQRDHEMKAFQSSVAMTVTLISFGMMFSTLFLGYFLVRFNSPMWPPVEIQDMPQTLPLLSTLVMALSSLTYWMLEKKVDQRRTYWALTLFLGLAFLGLQWTLWAKLKEVGILVSNGMVPSMVYAFTWLHAAHIVLGLIALLWIGYLMFQAPLKLSETKLTNVGKFWHFLGVVWVLMYLMMFVV